ncbi:MAG: fluoride efflux transporter CrcB [Eggerthellaceae bacterium]
MLLNALIVGCGGFIGAALRYVCAELLSVFSTGAFPLATFMINFTGSFLIGVGSIALPVLFPDSKMPLLFATTGVLGGFTTFSTFSLETFGLLEESRYAMAGIYALSSVVVCVVGVCAGRLIARGMVGQP